MDKQEFVDMHKRINDYKEAILGVNSLKTTLSNTTDENTKNEIKHLINKLRETHISRDLFHVAAAEFFSKRFRTYEDHNKYVLYKKRYNEYSKSLYRIKKRLYRYTHSEYRTEIISSLVNEFKKKLNNESTLDTFIDILESEIKSLQDAIHKEELKEKIAAKRISFDKFEKSFEDLTPDEYMKQLCTYTEYINIFKRAFNMKYTYCTGCKKYVDRKATYEEQTKNSILVKCQHCNTTWIVRDVND